MQGRLSAHTFALMLKLLCFLLLQAAPAEMQTLLVTWNLENFFDPKCDSLSTSEMEFSASGARRWTWKRFSGKCNGVARTLLAVSTRCGRIPDMVAVQEIENRRVLRRLLEDTPLRKLDYRIVHYESPDRRGIDCALLYRSGRFRLEHSAACHLYDSSGALMRTRDILLAVFSREEGPEFAVLVNHHPSKLGGGSSSRRDMARARMAALADSLEAAGCRRIVAVGDFNSEMQWADPGCPGGSLKFNGRWERIDGCALARGGPVREQVLDFPFLLTRDSAHGGLKPLRTYSGPRHLGGLSDHLPVAVWF